MIEIWRVIALVIGLVPNIYQTGCLFWCKLWF